VPTFTPAAFDYYPVESLDEAIDLMKKNDDAKVIAGGQSLLAMMKLRLLTPRILCPCQRRYERTCHTGVKIEEID